MIKSKKINVIVAVAVAFSLFISIGLVVKGNIWAESGSIKTEAEYATKIFGTDIISIEIIADEADWQEMLDNATREEYIMADVVVNGTKFQNVGIRPKGNSSLTQVAISDSDRYSFRLQFDEYIKGQTCFGLESFVVNNMLGDNTYMKEYISYELMKEIGVDAPYFGYADINVNGESWGLYLAVELYNDSYEQRVFGNTAGMLYNVKSMDMGGKMPGQQVENTMPMPDGQNRPQRPDGNFQGRPGEQGDFEQSQRRSINLDKSNVPALPDDKFKGMDGGPRGRGGSSGGSLEYVDDNIESYSAIFNNVVGKGTESDFQSVVQAIKALSEGKELENYFDIDQILRYLAAHTIVVNLDSYSSSMAQNYYIYESDGKNTILPWDYNLAWGGFQSGSASSVINFPIDTPVSGVEMSSRPLIDKLFKNAEYLERYHSYLQQLIDTNFDNAKFDERINTLDNLISDYVKNDATAFCTYEEYKTAISTFINLGKLRAQSVQGQLDGTIPSTSTEQNSNSQKLVSAGDLKLSELGSMMGGRGGKNMGFPDRINGQDKNSSSGDMMQGMDRELMSKVMDIIRQANGEISDEVKEALTSLGLTAEQVDQITVMSGGRFGGMVQNSGDRTLPDNPGKMEQWGQDRNIPDPFAANASTSQRIGTNNMILSGALSLILIAAILFAAKFKKSY